MKVSTKDNTNIQKQLPHISKTPQAKSQQTIDHIFNASIRQPRAFNDNSLKSIQNISNISFVKNERSDAKQDQYYVSPILTKSQLLEVERQSKHRKNEFYSQMLSENPFKFNDSQEEIHEHPRKVSSIHVNLFDLKDKEKLIQLLQETSEFSDKLSHHTQQSKPANVIIQRQEVIKLAQWIDYQMKTIIVDSKLKEDKMLHQIEQVFNQSLKELVREISVDCVEKGYYDVIIRVLLEKIWNQYVNFNTIIIQANQQEKNTLEAEYLNELKQVPLIISQVHQTYQLSVKVCDEKISQLESQLTQLKLKYNENEAHHIDLTDKHEHLFNDYKQLKQEYFDLKEDMSVALNEKDQLISQCNQILIEKQKLSKQLDETIQQKYLKSKRHSYVFQDADQQNQCTKSTSCYDLYATMGTNKHCQTNSPPPKASQQAQTDFRYFKHVGSQYENPLDESNQINSPKIPNHNSDELNKLRDIKLALEEKVRMEFQAQNELRKQKQQLQRENEAQKLKIANNETLIASLQKDIEQLQQQIDSNKTDPKQKEVTVVSIDQKTDQQIMLAPQQTQSTMKTQQKETTNKTQENLPEIKQPSVYNQPQKKPVSVENPIKQVQSKEQKQSIQPQQQQQGMKTTTAGFNKVRSVEAKDQKKSIKIVKNTQNIPRKQSQDSLLQQINISNSETNNTNEDFLNKALDELTKDGKQLKITPASNQKISISQQRRQSQQQNYMMLQQEKQQQFMSRMMKDRQENIYVDVALAFIRQLAQDFKLDPEQVENTLTIQNSLKLISQFYKEKLESKYPLYAICYEYYMNTYGLKNVAEQKMTQFCQSLVTYSENYRIKLFARFLQLYDNISNEDLEFYMQSLTQLDEQENPNNLITCNQEYVLISLSQAQRQLEMLSDSGKHVLAKLSKKIKTIKDDLFLDLDEYFQESLEQFQLNRTIQQPLFYTLKLLILDNSDNQIDIDQFTILYEQIEGNVNLHKYRQLFRKKCQNQNGIGFYQFCEFCLQHTLFQQEKQELFFRNNNTEEHMKQLKIHWGHHRKLFSKRFREVNAYNEYYQDLLRKLDDALKNNLSYGWILWIIIEEQSKRLIMNKQIGNIIGQELFQICDKYEYLCSIN